MKAILTLFLASALAAPSPKSTCRRQSVAGHRKLNAANYAGALSDLEEAAAACRAAGTSEVTPFLDLGNVYFRLKAYEKAASLFEEALRLEPALPVAEMNLGACQMIRGQFDRAIETTLRALGPIMDKHTLMQANFNIGLAYVKKAAAANRTVDPRAEDYFRNSRELDPGFGGSAFYLGVLAEVSRADFIAARQLYREGCQLSYGPACDALANVDRHALAAREPRATSDVPLSSENESRLNAFSAAYARRYDAKSAIAVASGLRHNCATVSAEQCRVMLDHTLSAVQ